MGQLGGLVVVVAGLAAPAWGCPWGWETASPAARTQHPARPIPRQRHPGPWHGQQDGLTIGKVPPEPAGCWEGAQPGRQGRTGVPSSTPHLGWDPCRHNQQILSGAVGWGALPGPLRVGCLLCPDCLHHIRGAALLQCPGDGGLAGLGTGTGLSFPALNSAPGAAKCPQHWGDCLTPRDLPARMDVGEQPGPLTRAGAVGVRLRAGFGREQPKLLVGAGARACGSR